MSGGHGGLGVSGFPPPPQDSVDSSATVGMAFPTFADGSRSRPRSRLGVRGYHGAIDRLSRTPGGDILGFSTSGNSTSHHTTTAPTTEATISFFLYKPVWTVDTPDPHPLFTWVESGWVGRSAAFWVSTSLLFLGFLGWNSWAFLGVSVRMEGREGGDFILVGALIRSSSITHTHARGIDTGQRAADGWIYSHAGMGRRYTYGTIQMHHHHHCHSGPLVVPTTE
ncbi:hypothetical protein QBC39DRAFT_138849 [Podospora conica]|nr:hypothetical protein QBC39DRAFT_138849 [Schizothecium conicum]